MKARFSNAELVRQAKAKKDAVIKKQNDDYLKEIKQRGYVSVFDRTIINLVKKYQ